MVYVQTGSILNLFWKEMLDAINYVDTRPTFLQAFETALSASMPPGKSIYETQTYKDIRKKYPLPADPHRIIPLNAYRAWIEAYTNILREFDMLGLIAEKPQELDGDIGSFMEEFGG